MNPFILFLWDDVLGEVLGDLIEQNSDHNTGIWMVLRLCAFCSVWSTHRILQISMCNPPRNMRMVFLPCVTADVPSDENS